MAILPEQLSTSDIDLGDVDGTEEDVITSGDTFEREFEWTDKETGDPIDFSGYTGKAEIRDLDGTLLTSFVVSALDATGIYTLKLDESQTMLAEGLNRYDFQISKTGVTKTLHRGKIKVDEDVTA